MNDGGRQMGMSFTALGLLPFQINLHYVDTDPASTHMGETREERIEEFLEENHCPVLAMYEGTWLRVSGPTANVEGAARLFEREGCEAFADGVDVSHLLDLTPVFDGGRRPSRGPATPIASHLTLVPGPVADDAPGGSFDSVE